MKGVPFSSSVLPTSSLDSLPRPPALVGDDFADGGEQVVALVGFEVVFGEALRFFDHYLKGAPYKPPPAIRYFLQNAKPGTEWRRASRSSG